MANGKRQRDPPYDSPLDIRYSQTSSFVIRHSPRWLRACERIGFDSHTEFWASSTQVDEIKEVPQSERQKTPGAR
ncbi:MAG: hypothetical protein ACM35G_05585, partial [Planctomycetaceae bacterium]